MISLLATFYCKIGTTLLKTHVSGTRGSEIRFSVFLRLLILSKDRFYFDSEKIVQNRRFYGFG